MNAKHARRISSRNMVKNDKKYINKINQEIKEATKNGKTNITLFRYADNFDEEKISYYRSLGFEVLQEGDARYKLSW
jgi:ribosomal protein S18 acetylase RimI-like enzyme